MTVKTFLTKPLIKSLIVASTAGIMMTTAQADTIYGVYADVDYWHTSVDGEMNGSSGTYDDEGQVMAAISVEHPVPFLPNFRARHTSLNAEGKLDSQKSELDMSSTDAIAYYEVLDNVVSADIGLGAKMLDGDYMVNTTATDVSETLPMAYASVGADLPFTGFSAKAELGIAKGSDAEATDAQVEVKYNFVDTLMMDVGAKVGYRVLEVDYDDDKTKLSTDFKGPYAGLEIHF